MLCTKLGVEQGGSQPACQFQSLAKPSRNTVYFDENILMLELENSSLLPPSPGSLLCFYYWLQLTVTATHQSECDTGVCAGVCQLITQRPYMMGCLKTMPQNSYTTPITTCCWLWRPLAWDTMVLESFVI